MQHPGRAHIAATGSLLSIRRNTRSAILDIVLLLYPLPHLQVQYPGLANSVSSDLATMRLLCRAAQAVFPRIRLAWLYEELGKKLEVELDFRWAGVGLRSCRGEG